MINFSRFLPLQTDQIDVRLKAVSLLGRLFALPGRHVAQEYRQLFSEFLKRFSDKAIEVRLAVIECAKACLEANPTGPEATDILGVYNFQPCGGFPQTFLLIDHHDVVSLQLGGLLEDQGEEEMEGIGRVSLYLLVLPER